MLLNDTKIKKEELLIAVRSNLEQHKKDVQEALELRRSEMLDYYKMKIHHIENDPSYQPKENENFPMPQDNSSDYEKAICMLEMTQDKIIELNEDQFDKLVMDNWHWKNVLKATSAMYGKSIN